MQKFTHARRARVPSVKSGQAVQTVQVAQPEQPVQSRAARKEQRRGNATMLFWFVMLATLVLLGCITGLKHGLIDPDEGRYAEIPREMIESGDFVTPRLNYVKYFEKPVLHYWLTAVAFKIWGENEPAARAVPVIFGLGGVVLTFMITRKMFAARTAKGNVQHGQTNTGVINLTGVIRVADLTSATRSGFFAATILSSSILWYAMSHMNLTDMTLTFFFTLAMTAYYFWHMSSARDNRWILIFYTSMALAVLTKGLIGVVLPGGIALLHRVFIVALADRLGTGRHDRRAATVATMNAAEISNAIANAGTGADAKIIIKSVKSDSARFGSGSKMREILKLFPPLGIALFFVIVLPWFVLVCLKNSDFFQFFFIHEHFLRYITKVHGRWEPFWFFIPIMLAALLPWTGLLIDVFHVTRGRWGVLRRSDSVFLALWALLPFMFFSLSGSKLVPYILPCLPPIAILMGAALEVMMDRNSLWGARRFVVLSGLLIVPVIIAGIFYPKMHPEVPASLTLPLVVTLLVFWLTSFGLFWKRRVIVPVLCLLALVVPLSSSHAFNYFADLDSQREIALMIKERIREGDKVVAWRELMQGLAFYMNRRIITAGTLNELEFGANALRHDTIIDKSTGEAAVITENNTERSAGEIEFKNWFMDSRELRRLWNGPNRVFLVARRKHVADLTKELGRAPVRLGETAGEILCANF